MRERPRTSTPSDIQEKGSWKIRWPGSPAKKRAAGRPAPSGARNRIWGTLRSCALVERRLAGGIEAAFGDLPADRFVALDAFQEHAAAAANPLLEDDAVAASILAYGWGNATEEDREALWIRVLGGFLTARLLHFGGARLGVRPDGSLAFAVTSVGRYLCGRSDELELDAPDSGDGAVVVQPNFEVVFLAPAPHLEAALARIAERLGSGVGTLAVVAPGQDTGETGRLASRSRSPLC